MNKETNNWVYSLDGERYDSSEYDSRDMAIAAARKEYESEKPESFYVARVVEWEPCIDAENVIDDLRGQAFDDADEWADGYLEEPPFSAGKTARNLWRQQLLDLSQRLTATFKEWAKETKNEPTFFTVIETEEIPFAWGDAS